MIVNLVCSKITEKAIKDILTVNNIVVSSSSNVLIVEDGCEIDADYDVKIVYKKDRIFDFEQVINKFKGKDRVVDTVLGMNNGAYRPINIQDVCYFNAINNDTFVHLVNSEQYIVKSKLYQLQEELTNNFFRINKSELINMKKIKLITPMFKGKLIIYLNGYKEPFDISRGYTKAFKERLGF